MAKLVWASHSTLANAGSNPGKDVFDFLHKFCQFLNVHNTFQQTFANRGPFPLKSRGSTESVGIELDHGPLRPFMKIVFENSSFT